MSKQRTVGFWGPAANFITHERVSRLRIRWDAGFIAESAHETKGHAGAGVEVLIGLVYSVADDQCRSKLLGEISWIDGEASRCGLIIVIRQSRRAIDGRVGGDHRPTAGGG